MGTYIMLGKYSREGTQDISADRTRRVGKLVEKLGGKVEAIFAVLGKYDLVMRLQLPDTATAMKASIELGKLTGTSCKRAKGDWERYSGRLVSAASVAPQKRPSI